MGANDRAVRGLRRARHEWAMLCLCALLAGVADFVAAADEAGFETVRFRHFGVDRGLSQATVRAIAQDARGFMWLGTQEGLNRFDGYEFKTYLRSLDHDEGLPDNHVTALAAGPDESLWVGTQNGGLTLLDPDQRTFRRWPAGRAESGGLAANPVTALLERRWGGLWIASGTGSLQFLESPDAPLVQVGAGMHSGWGQIRRLREAGDGSLLMATARGIWRVGDPKATPERIEAPGLPILDAQDVVEAFDGSLWIATDSDGVWRVVPGESAQRQLHLAEGLPDPNTRVLLFDRSGRLWIGSLVGLSRWDVDRRQLEVWRGDRPSPADGLSAPRVEALFEDRDGLIWVGTWLDGVNLLDPRTEAFATGRPVPGNPRSLPGQGAIEVFHDPRVGLWVSLSELNQAVRLDPDKGVVERISGARSEQGVAAGQIRAIAVDGQSVLWLAMGRQGLLRRAPGGEVERYLPGDVHATPGGEIFELHVDAAGTLWVGSIGSGLARLCSGCDRFESVLPSAPGTPGAVIDDIASILQTRDGSLWLGTRHHGAARMPPAGGELEVFPPDQAGQTGPSHAYVTGYLEDTEGTLWAGSQGGGLMRIARDAQGRPTRFERIDRSRGLAADAIGGLQQDLSGNIWIGTTGGLSRIDPKSAQIVNFGEFDGALAGGYFIGASARLPDGRLLFGGPRGLTLFDPRDVQPPPAPNRIAISAVRLFGEDGVDHGQAGMFVRDPLEGDRLLLSDEADDFTLEFTALSYASPDQLRFEYRLEPFEPWRQVGSRRRFASYNNVPPGEYIFHARAVRPEGGASEPYQLRVTVPEPAQTLWRRIALPSIALLATVLLWVLWQRRKDQLRAQRRLADSESRLKLALWGTGDEMWDYDLAKDELRRENPLGYLRTGGDEQAGGAHRLTRFVHPDDKPGFREAMRRVVDGEADMIDITARFEREGGGYVWLRSRGRVAERSEDGGTLRITGTTSDLTELKESAAALEEANRELENRVEERTSALTSANRELAHALDSLRRAQGQLVEQEKMAALGGLVAGVAHEINTPVGIGVTAASHLESAARDFAERVRAGALTRSELQAFLDVAGESADLILRNLQRADRLIRSFKQVAVDQGSEDRRRIDLAQYMEEILLAWQPRLRKSHHRVVSDIPDGLQIDTLPGAVYQVISNLIQNALVHAFAEREGGGTIHIEARAVDGRLKLVFSDDGVGMEEATRQRVFDPFFTTRRGSGGSGLGLHIVYNLVTQALNGSIECESSPGAGVRFLIDWPLEAPESGAAGQGASG